MSGGVYMCEVHEKNEKRVDNKETCCCKSCGHEHNHEHNHEHKHEPEISGCGCGHDHEHGEEVGKKEIGKIFLSLALLIMAILIGEYAVLFSNRFEISLGNVETLSLVIFLISYLIVGGEVVRAAVRNICKGKIFDENFLMSLATVGAFFIGEYPEAVAVMMLYQIGELFQGYAVGKSRKSITKLMDIRPDIAYVKLNDGTVVEKNPEEVRIGEIVVVKPGEKVALDGKLAKGQGTVDVMALTGESLPREVYVGDDIISGSVSVSGVLEIEVTKEFGQSTVSKVLELVENASQKKANSEKFITKFARYYTPIVVVAAVLLAVIPSCIEGVADAAIWSKWLYRALSFLVISCPCALVISVPLSFFAGIGGASVNGILIKGSTYMEILAKVRTVVFDKTGTLTKGNFKVTEIELYTDKSELEVLRYATIAEVNSNHPIAVSLREAYKIKALQGDGAIESVEDIENSIDNDIYEEIAGYGIKAAYNGEIIYVGNAKLMDLLNISYKASSKLGTVVYVAVGESDDNISYIGAIIIADEIKTDSKEAIKKLSESGVNKTVMLTGDRGNIAEYVGNNIGITDIYSELLPGDKVEKLEAVLSNVEANSKVAFVGDGINDAPVLARADVGIAMGGLGQDAAIEAADVVIMDDKPSNIAKAINISKKTLRIVKQNIAFAIGIKVLVMFMAAVGMASMWYAVFADVGVCFIAILNALRAMKYKD